MMRSAASARIGVRPILRQVRSGETETFLATYFREEILPLLTPIALDRGHPLPVLRSGAWGVVVRFRAAHGPQYGIVLVHSALPAFIEAPAFQRVALEHVIAAHLPALFRRFSIESCWTFRIADPDDGAVAGPRHQVEDFLATALEKSYQNLQEPAARTG